MDVESRKRWVDYSRAKDVMFAHTDRKKTPWYVVNADKRREFIAALGSVAMWSFAARA
jgi:polyphosphate kinase 2 (PPK2 family)